MLAYFKQLPRVTKVVLAIQVILILVFAGLFFNAKKNIGKVDVDASVTINKKAWEASFTERSLPIPEQGPREGYWGSRLEHQTYDLVLGWRLSEQEIPRLISVDNQGLQHIKSENPKAFKLFILGASVAFGAYASDQEHTYFGQLQKLLAEKGVDVDITVASAGAWKSEQSLAALMKFFDTVKPDAVMYINGLNSLTVGSSAHTRYGEKVEIEDGSEWSLLYHEHDYEARTKVYLENMGKAKKFALEKHLPIFFFLQPALFEKKHQSAIEVALNASYSEFLGPNDVLKRSYDQMNAGMQSFADSNSYFLDLSNAFDSEKATTFTDMWHFSDPGHRIVAEKISTFMAPILRGINK